MGTGCGARSISWLHIDYVADPTQVRVWHHEGFPRLHRQDRAELVDEAHERSLSTHAEILGWLKEDYGLGVGHARAIAHVILKGPEFGVKQTSGTHRGASGTLRLTGRSA